MRRQKLLIVAASLLITSCLSACVGPYGDYGGGYPDFGYSPYSWGGSYFSGYDPGFNVGHPYEEHFHDGGHHEVFHSGGGFHGGAGGHPEGGHGGDGHGGGSHGGGHGSDNGGGHH